MCSDSSPHPLSSTAISLAFWLTLILASAMYAALALANRLQETFQLRAQIVENAYQADLIQSEIDHLSRLLSAYQSDPDFIQRVVEKDFGQDVMKSEDHTQRMVLNLEPSLMFDAREFRQDVTKAVTIPWYGTWVERLATPGEFQSRWRWATLVLFGLSFICLNEDFFQGRLGRTMVWVTRVFGARYRVD